MAGRLGQFEKRQALTHRDHIVIGDRIGLDLDLEGLRQRRVAARDRAGHAHLVLLARAYTHMGVKVLAGIAETARPSRRASPPLSLCSTTVGASQNWMQHHSAEADVRPPRRRSGKAT